VFRERVGTGLAATALGALVLLAVLAGGLLILDGLSGGGLFGADPAPGNPYAVLESVDLSEPGDEVPESAPPQADPTPAPAPPATPTAPAAPTAPAPAAAPPAPPSPDAGLGSDQEPVTPTIPDVLPPPGEAADDSLRSVVRLSADTVDGAAGTIEDLVGLTTGLLNPADARYSHG